MKMEECLRFKLVKEITFMYQQNYYQKIKTLLQFNNKSFNAPYWANTIELLLKKLRLHTIQLLQ